MCKENEKEVLLREVKENILEKLKEEKILNFGLDIFIMALLGISLIGLMK